MVEGGLVLLTLLWASFFTGSEMGAYCVNRIRLRFRAQLGSPGARTLERLLSDREMLVSTTLAGTNLGHYAGTALCTAVFSRLDHAYAELWSTLLLAPVILVFAELIPKTVFAAHANHVMLRAAPVLRAATFLLWPVVLVLKGIMLGFDSVFGRAEPQGVGRISLPRLRHFLEEGAHDGVLSPEQDRMARNIMHLERIRLRDVMVPLHHVAALPETATGEDVLQRARRHTYSRLPVYAGARTNIVGILGLVGYLLDGAGRPVREVMRPPLKISQDTPMGDALLTMRRAREPMAVVVDAAGRAVGIATIKDLVEEIVGELAAW